MGSDGDRGFGQMYSGHTQKTTESDQERAEMVSLTRNGHDHIMTLEEGRSELVNGATLPETSEPRVMSCVQTWLQPQLYHLPIVTFLFIMLSFIICYVIAVSLGHVEPDFPYISHTAIETPERYIFAQMVNIGALMLAANVYMRYKQMNAYLHLISAQRKDYCINRSAIVIGFISAFGLSMVANFQTRDVKTVHYIGAFLSFVLGMVYCWLQTSLSVRNSKKWNKVTVIQIIISIVLSICLSIFIASKTIYKVKKEARHGTKHDTLRGVYLVSTTSEWLTAILVIVFVLTFCRDFANSSVKSLDTIIKNESLAKKLYRSSSMQDDSIENNSIFV